MTLNTADAQASLASERPPNLARGSSTRLIARTALHGLDAV